MIACPEMILCVSSKVFRYVLDQFAFEYLIGLQRVLPALATVPQLDRPDLPETMQIAIMNIITGPKVNNMLRGPLLEVCNVKGFHHFVVRRKGVGFDTTIVLPCDAEGTPAHTGKSGATSRHVLLCHMNRKKPVLLSVPPGAGGSDGDDVRICVDMATLVILRASDELPCADVYRNFIFVCDPAGDKHARRLKTSSSMATPTLH